MLTNMIDRSQKNQSTALYFNNRVVMLGNCDGPDM